MITLIRKEIIEQGSLKVQKKQLWKTWFIIE